MATSKTVAASALDFGFLRLVYSHARQLRLKRKEAAGGGVEKGGLRQVILDVAQGVRKASRTRRFLGGGAYDRGARGCSEEKHGSARIVARKEGGSRGRCEENTMTPDEGQWKAGSDVDNDERTGASKEEVTDRKKGKREKLSGESAQLRRRLARRSADGGKSPRNTSLVLTKGSQRSRARERVIGKPRQANLRRASDSKRIGGSDVARRGVDESSKRAGESAGYLTTGASPSGVRKPGRSSTKPRSLDEKNNRFAVGEKEGRNADGVESASRSKGSDRNHTQSGSPRRAGKLSRPNAMPRSSDGENHASDADQNLAGADRLRNGKQGEEIAGGRSKSDAKVGWGKKSRLTNSGLRCMFLMSDACQGLNATTSVEGLLELHALLKLVEPRVHEFKGLSVAFWQYLKHLLGCCEERLSWGRDMDILREIQMYWADHVGWYEGRTKRTRIGCRSAVLERSKVADGDTSAPPAGCKEHDEMKGDGRHGGVSAEGSAAVWCAGKCIK
ncbi:hypothetical protein FOL46_006176 [Perkinsus olseni]|uniref:Uncharacterized protein n=1 Tax=Perkinsus olseni TaxID=32597 RepID=A0A7J6LM31_PEROL|nr:hypothetical protein FOL46_006176 [Perkinsus olseni]